MGELMLITGHRCVHHLLQQCEHKKGWHTLQLEIVTNKVQTKYLNHCRFPYVIMMMCSTGLSYRYAVVIPNPTLF